MKVAILESDYLPDPPTPSNKALPSGYRMILAILEMCSQASKNITKRIAFLEPAPTSLLYSS